MDLTRDALLDLFRRSGALLEGHFRLTSGLHSPGYLQCALVLQHPSHADAVERRRSGSEMAIEVVRPRPDRAAIQPAPKLHGREKLPDAVSIDAGCDLRRPKPFHLSEVRLADPGGVSQRETLVRHGAARIARYGVLVPPEPAFPQWPCE